MARPDTKCTRRSFVRAAAALASSAALGGCRRSADQSRSRIGVGDSLARLRSSLDGALIVPDDPQYDQARRVASFNPRSDRRPAVIVRCASVADVARSLEYARSSGLEVAVRSGGHDVMGQSVCEGGVLIDLALMNELAISVPDRIARVGAGVRAGHLDGALQGSGLAAVLGCSPVVGLAGLTLGGGLGWLAGRFGASCDNLAAVEIVTADGRQLRVTGDEHADLFWGLRGGGGNFGVVTALEYRLQPLQQVVAGYMIYPGERAEEFLRLYRDFMADAPDELTLEVVLLASAQPPLHAPVVGATACYCGAPGEAQRVLAPLRAFGPPLVDVVRENALARLTDAPPQALPILRGNPAAAAAETRMPDAGFGYWQGGSLSGWSDAAIKSFIACAAEAPPGWSMGIGHYMHGELCRVSSHESCLPRAPGRASYFFNMSWREPERSTAAMQWVEQSIEGMRPFADPTTYVNYLSAGSKAAVAAAYAGNYARLEALKRAYDPDNVFHLNRNIRPA